MKDNEHDPTNPRPDRGVGWCGGREGGREEGAGFPVEVTDSRLVGGLGDGGEVRRDAEGVCWIRYTLVLVLVVDVGALYCVGYRGQAKAGQGHVPPVVVKPPELG